METARGNRPLAGTLALLSLALPAGGVALLLGSAGSLAGLALLVAGIPLAVLAWVALGRPVTRRDLPAR